MDEMPKRRKTPPRKAQQQFNTQDIISNLRVADEFLVKINDFFFSVPFLSSPILWKVLIILFILMLPLMAIISLFGLIGGIIAVLTGNVFGVLAAVISIGYLGWTAKTTVFNPDSDLSWSRLGTWSKVVVAAMLINLVLSSIMNVFTRGAAGLITVLITDFIVITLSLYLVPFEARYFWGVVLDDLEPHPKSTAFLVEEDYDDSMNDE